MNIKQRISPDAINKIQDEINSSNGQEVLCIGRSNSNSVIDSLLFAARGNYSAVPALLPAMEKGDVIVHNHPSGILQPSDADIRIASRLGNMGIGFYIINNSVTDIYCVCEPISKKTITPIDIEKTVKIIGPDGLLTEVLGKYEPRDAQQIMAEEVAKSFNGNCVCAIEAGTGVGKSFAYLLPAMQWAIQNDERIVISTATINLQQQLIQKDIPIIQEVLKKAVKHNVVKNKSNDDFCKAVLVKGRGNYLCLRRSMQTEEINTLFTEDSSELKSIIEWSKKTSTGDKNDLSFYPSDYIWSQVCSESDGCMGLRCAYREECFVLKARKDAAAASLLVVNHHLLFADLALRMNSTAYDTTVVLPPFKRLIFDEAHTLEKSATSFFSEYFSCPILIKQLNRLYQKSKSKPTGIITKLLPLSDHFPNIDKIPDMIPLIKETCLFFDNQMEIILAGNSSFRLRQEIALPEETIAVMLKLKRNLSVLLTALTACLNQEDDEYDSENESLLFELTIIASRINNMARVIGDFLTHREIEDQVFWIERKKTKKGEPFISLVTTPLEVGNLMQNAVFTPYETVVCTSATLTVGKSFTYWMSRVGLHDFSERPVNTIQLESPFKFREQVLLVIPEDAPDPNQPEYQQFISTQLFSILECSQGGGLILFTSYKMLLQTFEQTAPLLQNLGINLYKQGDDHRDRLLDRFKNDISSVLFAVDSFWEGIDTPGESLQVVIICRLPFQVPTDPVIQARMELLEKRGENSFIQLSLPQAAIKLKQGFGRLMRRSDDKGIVAILDPRIVRKPYGKVLLKSLPETKTIIKSSKYLLDEIESFLYSPKL